MPEIIALTCPVCGAPLAPGIEKCAHCGSYIVIKTDLPRLERHTLNQAVIQEHISDFRKRIRSNQYDEEAHYGLGVAYYSLGLIHDAIEELTSAARLMPENPHIQSQLAVALYDAWKAGDTGVEVRLNQRIASTLLLDPDNIEAFSLKIEILIGKGQLQDAADAAQSLYRQHGPSAKAKLVSTLTNLGERALAASQWDEAAWCWQTLNSIDVEASSALALEFMALNAPLAPREYRRRTSPSPRAPFPSQPSAPPATASRMVKLVLTILGGILCGLILMTIVMTVGVENTSTAGAGRSFLALFLLLAAPIGLALWYWKRSDPSRTGNVIQTESTIPAPGISSRSLPTVDHSKVIAAAEKTLKSIKFHQGMPSPPSPTLRR